MNSGVTESIPDPLQAFGILLGLRPPSVPSSSSPTNVKRITFCNHPGSAPDEQHPICKRVVAARPWQGPAHLCEARRAGSERAAQQRVHVFHRGGSAEIGCHLLQVPMDRALIVRRAPAGGPLSRMMSGSRCCSSHAYGELSLPPETPARGGSVRRYSIDDDIV